MQQQCAKHVFEGAEDVCGTCGGKFCDECLVYAFGPRKPPLCLQCAVAAAGIRASAGKRGAWAFRWLRRPRIDDAGLEMPSPAMWPDVRLSMNP